MDFTSRILLGLTFVFFEALEESSGEEIVRRKRSDLDFDFFAQTDQTGPERLESISASFRRLVPNATPHRSNYH